MKAFKIGHLTQHSIFRFARRPIRLLQDSFGLPLSLQGDKVGVGLPATRQLTNFFPLSAKNRRVHWVDPLLATVPIGHFLADTVGKQGRMYQIALNS